MSAGSPKPKEPTVALLPGTSASSVTFVISEEDHTLGNALRYAIARNPAVTFCGYSVPHPSEERINLRVQASGPGGAEAAFRRGLSDLSEIVDHIKSTFVAALDTQEVAGGGGGGAGAAAAAAAAAAMALLAAPSRAGTPAPPDFYAGAAWGSGGAAGGGGPGVHAAPGGGGASGGRRARAGARPPGAWPVTVPSARCWPLAPPRHSPLHPAWGHWLWASHAGGPPSGAPDGGLAGLGEDGADLLRVALRAAEGGAAAELELQGALAGV